MINSGRNIKYFFVVIIFSLILGVIGTFSLINYLFILVCFLALIFFPQFNLLLFIIFLFTNGMISTEYNIIGLIHVNRIINLFAIITILKYYSVKHIELNLFQKYSISLSIFIFLFIIALQLKFYFFDIDKVTTLNEVLKRTLKYIVMLFPMILFIRLLSIKYFRDIFLLGIQLSIVFLSLSIIFSPQLNNLGFETKGLFTISNDIIDSQRKAGFFMSEGDENSVGGYLALASGLVLLFPRINRERFSNLLIVSIAFVGIIGTISRAGIVSFIIVLLLYFFASNRIENIYFRLVSFIVVSYFLYLFTGLLDNYLFRFSRITDNLNSAAFDNRLGGWLFYIEFIFQRVNVLFWGTTESIYNIYRINWNRVAHNFYISLIYQFGIIPFIYLLILFIKFYKSFIKRNKVIYFLILFIPLIIITNTTSDTAIFFLFALIIPTTKHLKES